MKCKSFFNTMCNKKKLSIGFAVAISLGCLIPNCLTPTCFASENNDVPSASFELDKMTVEAKRPDWESRLSPGTVTVIRPDDYKGEQKTLPDLLKKVPGIHVREVNGRGHYTTVSVRGSTAAQVGIFIDGVLTNLGGDSAVDISTLPIKNVERVEVYRGYIPSRFGGTFMGGVINIVTKRPTETNISAEMGRAAYGGANYALEVDAPLGDGSILVGINREQSDGDFKYNNFSSKKQLETVNGNIQSFQNEIENFDANIIESDDYISLTSAEKDYYKTHLDEWENFRSDMSTGSDNFYNRSLNSEFSKAQTFGNEGKIADLWAGISQDKYHDYNDFSSAWRSSNDNEKEEVYRDFAQNVTTLNKNKMDPEKSDALKSTLDQLEKNKKDQKDLENNERTRKYNDFKNTDAIIKWQNDNWAVKGTWKKIDRHMPDSVWCDDIATAVEQGSYVDLRDVYYAESRRQQIDSKEIQVERRDEIGKLEWGWMVNYMDQNKKYNVEKKLQPNSINWLVPMRDWSKYDSNRYSMKVDGTYNIKDSHLLEFMANYSKEKMDIHGSGMSIDPSLSDAASAYLKRFRNHYELDLVNVQIQDTITLNDENNFWLTPSVRFNQSTVLGSSTRMSKKGDHQWFNISDKQTDKKVTWQLALKKKFSDNLTMRSTFGTYYRLLNLYEIAGDGAGILPPPATENGITSVFPSPEDGKQFDISVLLNSKMFGADASFVVTGFWRDADNMLTLSRRGLDYWSYYNDSRGQTHGVEIENNFIWDKFDLNLNATYTKNNIERRNTAAGYAEWESVWHTYSPKWEGAVRLNYNPSEKYSMFTEVKYVDEMFTRRLKDIKAGGHYSYLKGVPQSSLITVNAGFKITPNDSILVTVGCNDIFNKGPENKILFEDGYVNNDFPIQGRTAYATVKYKF